MIKTEILSLKDKDVWNLYLNRLGKKGYDVYFTPAYYELYQQNGDGILKCFVFESEGQMALYPFLLNSVNDLGYSLEGNWFDIQGAYGYNGVISSTFEISFIHDFYKGFSNFCLENNIIAEFTRFHPILNNQIFSVSHMEIIQDRETVFLNLTNSYEQIWGHQYSGNNRNMIRKAIRQGFTTIIHSTPSLEQIKRFVAIYQCAMLEKGTDKYYLFDEQYFMNIFDLLKDKAFLIEVVDDRGNIINVSIILLSGNYANYHLSARVKGADNSSNNFLLDEAVKFSKVQGAKTFYFGGGTTSNPSDSLLKFKSNFSKEQATFYIGRKIYNQKIYAEVIRQWEEKHLDLVPKNQNQLLRYRNI